MFGNTVRVILALAYLFAGGALLLGRKRFEENGRAPNLTIPGVLLVLSFITTLAHW
jgi:hypothetical protein